MTLVPDFDRFEAVPSHHVRVARIGGSALFWQIKNVMDVFGALLMLPLIVILALLLSVLNPALNPGPLFFRQERMGQNGRVFHVLKFRTMACAAPHRGALDPVETDRISRFARFLRRTGIDELPQALNVLRGEMSLIGPRPDCASHARTFLQTIPEYRHRLCVKPGMSGYAQITIGYAAGLEETRAKVGADLDYIARAGFRLDFWITCRTILTLLLARGD